MVQPVGCDPSGKQLSPKTFILRFIAVAKFQLWCSNKNHSMVAGHHSAVLKGLSTRKVENHCLWWLIRIILSSLMWWLISSYPSYPELCPSRTGFELSILVLKIIFIYFYLCMCICVYTWHSACVQFRGQLCGIGSLLPSLHLFQGLYLGHQTSWQAPLSLFIGPVSQFC